VALGHDCNEFLALFTLTNFSLRLTTHPYQTNNTPYTIYTSTIHYNCVRIEVISKSSGSVNEQRQSNMAPTQTRKRKSEDMATPEAVTPTGSPTSKRMKITEPQKQALVDNLQLESEYQHGGA
jgi:hypothetical protein